MEKVINNTDFGLKTDRSSNFEILRIISIIMIVFCHFASHGGFNFENSDLSLNRIWLYLIEMGGNIGVNIFVIISGYFLINNRNKLFDLKKILKLWGKIFFYSIFIYFIFIFFLDEIFTLKTFVKAALPLLFTQWWFATTYMVLYILHPFINMLLNKLNKKTYQILLTILLFLWCIIPTFTTRKFEGNSLTWFITLYAFAGYVRLYGLNYKLNVKHYSILFLFFFLVTFASAILFTIIGAKIPVFGKHAIYFYAKNRLPTFLISLSLFMVFANIKMKNYKWINIISASTFGVYLIHDHRLVRYYIWINLFQNSSFQNSNLLIPYSIGVSLIVFTFCLIIDLIRKYSIGILYDRAVDKWADTIVKPIKWIIDVVSKLVFGKDD